MNPRFPFSPYPSGWFALARSVDLPPKGVLPLHLFGHELVLFRTEDGQARLSEAYCPHLGAHLGHGGSVVGQSLRCPFHGWCFDGDSGRCTEIPFARKIPPRARITTWPVRELDGMVLVYRGPDASSQLGLFGQEPSWEVPAVQSDEWTGPTYCTWQLRTCCLEILENTVDAAHLPAVHDARRPGRYIPATTDGPTLRHTLQIQWDGAYIGAPGTELDVELSISCHGLGIIFVDTFVAAMGMRARQRLYITPIDEQRVQLTAVLHVHKLESPETTQLVEKMWSDAFQADFVKDFPIWENKIYQAQPLLSEADGPVAILRRWARQFYAPGQGAPAPAVSAADQVAHAAPAAEDGAPPSAISLPAATAAPALLRQPA